jgi:PQQ-dependent dehydrogenase (methanol/ethanol family)
MSRTRYLLAAFLSLVTATAGSQPTLPRPIDDHVLQTAGEEWFSYGLTLAETRFSPLKQINTTNAHQLTRVWSYDIGPGGGPQGTPLLWSGTLYGITNWSVVFAVDALTAREQWRWDPAVNQSAVGPRICCGVISRGLAAYRNLVIAAIIDGRLVALDAQSGKRVWEARVGDPQDNYTITMAPRVAKGKVIIGVSGADFPTRGYFDAYDALTGRRAWRFYTVPGDPAKGFENAAMRRAAETWEEGWWKLGGGGAVWDGMAYDPELNLVYVATGNGPRDGGVQQGNTTVVQKDHLCTASILAVNADSGTLKWYFQMVPGEIWDYDGVQQLTLAELTIGGRRRKVIMQANKNGFFYVLDRGTGQFISGQPFSRVTWAQGLNPHTGRPIENPEARNNSGPLRLRPGGNGAHNTAAMSFNPQTGLVYIPTTADSSLPYFAGWNVRGVTIARPELPAIGPSVLESGVDALVAWDPVAQEMRWRTEGGGAITGGTVTTAGNLVLQTIRDGRLLVYTAGQGKKLLEIQTGLEEGRRGAGGMGPPITYMVGRKQYIAVMGGTGQIAGLSPGSIPVPPKLVTYALKSPN